jgi:hypothetical protein
MLHLLLRGAEAAMSSVICIPHRCGVSSGFLLIGHHAHCVAISVYSIRYITQGAPKRSDSEFKKSSSQDK